MFAMPRFVEDVTRICIKHLGLVVLCAALTFGSAASGATVYYLALADKVSAVEERANNTQAQLERHMNTETTYQREVRNILREVSANLSMTREDVAALRARIEE